MKKLFFYMTIVMVVSLNGMESNQIIQANPNCDGDALSTNVLLLGINQKIDAMNSLMKSQAQLIDTMGSTMIHLINAYKDHADVVDRASAATDSLTESLEKRGDLLQKSMNADNKCIDNTVYAEITDCTDAIDTCIEEVEEGQEKIEKKYQSLEKTMCSLKSQVKRLQKRVHKLESSHDQEHAEAEDPYEKRD
jgi:chromosome segregation ATPase